MSSAATKTFRFLTSDQIIKLHQTAISGARPCEYVMLEAAVASPMVAKYNRKEENVFQLAANLAEQIMKKHAYKDGNKRTAHLVADMFLKINGYKLHDTPMANDAVNTEVAKKHLALMTNQLDAIQLGLYYESIATPIASSSPEIIEYRNGATEY